MTQANWIRALRERLDPGEPLPSDQNVRFAVDGLLPQAVVQPRNFESLGQVLRLANEEELAVVPWGHGSRMGLGRIPRAVDLVILTTRWHRICEFEAADLTVTVEGGVDLSYLQETLVTKGLFLPIDPPFAERRTMGGIIATNCSGPSRLRYGTARDHLLGIRVVQADGTLVKGGGKVVKNVAGYDLNKLFIGSLGTLGIMVELTFKLSPIPETSSTFLLGFEAVMPALERAQHLFQSPLLPTFVTWIDSAFAGQLWKTVGLDPIGQARHWLAVGFDGSREEVAWETDEYQRMTAHHSSPKIVLEKDPAKRLRIALRDFPGLIRFLALGRITVLPTELVALIDRVTETVQRGGYSCACLAYVGNGVLWLGLQDSTPSRGASNTSLVQILRHLQAIAAEFGGWMVIDTAPPAIKKQVEVWGEPGDAWKLMQAIKKQLDPKGILNPGRFLGGI